MQLIISTTSGFFNSYVSEFLNDLFKQYHIITNAIKNTYA